MAIETTDDVERTRIIGNGTFSALIDSVGCICWCSINHFGGDPIFNSLLNNGSEETGFFDVKLANCESATQRYIPLTAILVTTLTSDTGDTVEIVDFAPRFLHYDRVFRPFQIFRIIRRMKGDPVIQIRMRPSFAYNSTDGYNTRGSHHLRFCGPKGEVWRCTTTAPVQQLLEESSFLLHDDSVYLIFGQDESFTSSIPVIATEFQEKTRQFWHQWCASLCLPVDFQSLLVRSAVTLMLQQSEECGGFISSISMCHPMGPNMKPTKDSRVCRLLDECLSIGVLRELGLFGTLKKFLTFCKTVCFRDSIPQHTYGHLGEKRIPLEGSPYLAGFRGVGEVTRGGVGPPDESVGDSTQAFMSGLLVLALSHACWDKRLTSLWSPKLLGKLEQLGEYIVDAFERFKESPPLWEPNFFDDDVRFFVPTDDCTYERGMHTFSAGIMWAAVDRLRRMHLNRNDEHKARHWAKEADAMRQEIWRRSWNSELNTITTFWDGNCVGPSLLRLPEIGFLKCSRKEDARRFRLTLERFEEQGGKQLFTSHFSTNTMMWYAEALRVTGRCKDSLDLVKTMCSDRLEIVERRNEQRSSTEELECGNVVNFLPFWQSIDLVTSKAWGNFPCTAAIFSIIRVTMRLSRTWRDL